METLSTNWNPDLNYWDLHPTLKTIKVFRDYYEADKSKKKEKSSKILWAIALHIDPNEKNPWRNTNPLDRKNLINIDYLQDPTFDWNNIQILELSNKYKELCLSTAEKSLVEFEEKLADRAKFISETKYTLDYYEENSKSGKLTIIKGTADQLDRMMVNTAKIYDQLDIIKQQLAQETIDSIGKGGNVESAGESGLL